MKKLLLLFFVIAASINLFAEKVSRQDAELVARNYYYQQYNLFKGALPYNEVVFLDVIEETRNGEVMLYVFTLENGYIIVSAEDAMTPVIGYSWESAYPKKKEAHYEWFLSQYIDNIAYLQEHAIEADFEIMNQWNRYATEDYTMLLDNREDVRNVPMLISATWNQDWPYNYYAPEDEDSPANGHTYAGCVATAMSMIMYYWQYPEHGSSSRQYYQYPYGTLSADFENTYYAWDAMLDNVSSGSNQDAVKAIAELQYHCGIAVHMDYGPDGSGAYSQDVPGSLNNYLRYHNASYLTRSGYSNTQWNNMLIQQLDNGYPVYYSGTEPPSYGHAFIVDGYNVEGNNTTFHFNFGWGGYGNGFFSSNNAGGYSLNQAMVRDIYPSENYPNHATGLTELTKKVGRFMDGSGPIENYLNNNTASWLINPQSANDSVEKISLFFDRFNVDGSDVMKIYDGENEDAPLLASYTGNDTPTTLHSTGNKMLVVFETDDTGNDEGFILRYTTTQHKFCNSTITLEEPLGTLDDGSGDKYYAPNSTCRYKITPEFANNLTITFTEFDTFDDNDFLEIYDLKNSTLLATLYGSELPDALTIESGKAFIIWRSDNFNEAAGWSFNWEADNVGIQQEEAFDAFTLFPNPAKEKISIAFESPSTENLSVEIISPEGKIVYRDSHQHFAGRYQNDINVSNLAKGIYFLRLSSAESSATKKIIIE